MKIYVAGRYKQLTKIEEYYKILENKGHKITNKWTRQDSIKPFLENKEKARKYINEDFNGITDADIFILISEYEVDARGCNIELGYALSEAKKGKLKIFVIDPSSNPSMFFLDPRVNLVKTFDEALVILNTY